MFLPAFRPADGEFATSGSQSTALSLRENELDQAGVGETGDERGA